MSGVPRHPDRLRGTMTEQPITDTWATILDRLSDDDAITPMLQGFLNLVEPKGIAAGTFYLEVPNDFTASMLNQRMRVSLLSAMGEVDVPSPVTSFYVPTLNEMTMQERAEMQARSDEAKRREVHKVPSKYEMKRSGAPLFAAEAEPEQDAVADNKEGGTGTRAKGEEGSMGSPMAKSLAPGRVAAGAAVPAPMPMAEPAAPPPMAGARMAMKPAPAATAEAARTKPMTTGSMAISSRRGSWVGLSARSRRMPP